MLVNSSRRHLPGQSRSNNAILFPSVWICDNFCSSIVQDILISTIAGAEEFQQQRRVSAELFRPVERSAIDRCSMRGKRLAILP